MSNNLKKSLTRKESNMSVTLNERIRTLRESLKLTQADLAHELGVSRLTYIAIESGEKKPTIEQIEKISSILKTTSKEILFPSLDTELNSNHNKDDYVARIYSDILTLINQKEKEAEIRGLENLLDGSAEGATCICESAGLSVCDHNWSLCNVVRDRIKQLKEELKGGKD